ncbi:MULTISPECIES: morphogenic membrane protein MmpA [Streptomyces]|uniref:morphogenic membrane protein MmpA n=1 Tax=Streptomyces TaxID=1883 RepID=UPI0009D4D39D|nr:MULTISPECIES: hypothetical protein [Streptomyces]ONI53038.1 hypothetical protein STIB_23850 [Streptomyces sp. IB2014 011-1]CAD5922351.1 conserved protein of unknown function [Streptomyces sp. KY70]CAD5990985.1 conserved protein of unknown function [Streptomyces sp. KY75]
MNASRTAARPVPFGPAQHHMAHGMALGMAIGGVVGLVWLGAMLYTLVSWIF